MKLEIVKNYVSLKVGAIIDKEGYLAEKLIKLGIAKVIGEKELKVEETKELKIKDKKTK